VRQAVAYHPSASAELRARVARCNDKDVMLVGDFNKLTGKNRPRKIR